MKKGFTLIELLVVIAIIGILSSVVLASLNTARGKGSDAAATEDLNNLRAQAELRYDTDLQTYLNVCTDTNVVAGVKAAASAEGFPTWLAVANNTNASPGAGCNSIAGGWVAWVALNKGAGGTKYWCVDNSGTSMQKTVGPSAAGGAVAATTGGCNGATAATAW